MFGKKFLARIDRAESNLTDVIKEAVSGISGILDEIDRNQEKRGEQASQAMELVRDIKESQADLISHASLQQERESQQDVGSELRKAIIRHDDAIEDMLEEWEELRDETRDGLTAVSKELHAVYDARIRDLEEEQKNLLTLCEVYQGQLLAMQRMAQDDPGWQKQLELMQEGLRPAIVKAGIQVTGQTGEKVDLSVHEIVDIVQTQDSERDGKVCQVYENGCIYMGKIRKKARVSAWRCVKGN